jgi:hypothetical protein
VVRVTAGHNIAASDDNAGDATSVRVQATSVAALHRRADSSGHQSDESARSASNVGVTADDKLVDGLEHPMSRRGHNSKRSKASGKRKEIVKRKSTDSKRTKAAPVVDLTDEHRTKAAPVVDLTDEHFDRAMEKIRREIDRRNAGLSPK